MSSHNKVVKLTILLISFLPVVSISFSQTPLRFGDFYSDFTSLNYGPIIPFSTITADHFQTLHSSIGYGGMVGIGWGYLHKSGMGWSISPSLKYSFFGKKDFKYELRSEDDQVLYAFREGYRKYSVFSLMISPLWHLKIKNSILFCFGPYSSFIIRGRHTNISSGKEYYYYHSSLKQYIPHLQPRTIGSITTNRNYSSDILFIGLQCKLVFPLKVHDDLYKAVSLEFQRSLTKNTLDKSIESMISFQFHKVVF